MPAQHVIQWRKTIWTDDYSKPGIYPYVTGEDASIDTQQGFVMLTPNEPGKSGRIFLPRKQEMEFFSIRFKGYFGNQAGAGGGADGIVAVFAPRYVYPPTSGEQLDFDGCGGFGVEFDTYQNASANDPDGQHVAVIRDMTNNHLKSEAFTANELENDAWHEFEIRNSAGTINVFFDGSSRLTYTIPNFVPFDGYFGFTAATAVSYNPHYIDDVEIDVPSRTKTDFGVWYACNPVQTDTIVVLQNNLPGLQSLTIDSVRIHHIAGPGMYILPSPVLPVTLRQGESTSIPVRFLGAAAGTSKALLIAYSASGERVIDTLTIELQKPVLTWSDTEPGFPVTHVDARSTVTVFLRNDGRYPVNIFGFRTTWYEFSVLKPDRFPLTIQPGDSVEVVIQFAPRTAGDPNALLYIDGECDSLPYVILSGKARKEFVHFAFKEPFVVRPGGEGYQSIMLASSPGDFSIREIKLRISFDTSVVEFLGATDAGSILPSNRTFETWLAASNRSMFAFIQTPAPLGLQGELFKIRFKEKAGDFACAPITIDSVILNEHSEYPGIPYAVGDTSTTCVNASCRIPGGVIRTGTARTSASPNPFSSTIHLAVELDAGADVRIEIRDGFGRILETIHNGPLGKGKSLFTAGLGRYSNGVYYFVCESPGGRSVHPVVLRK